MTNCPRHSVGQRRWHPKSCARKVGLLKCHQSLAINPGISTGGTIDFEATNQAAYEASLAQLVPCEYCGRKFASERLAIHQKSCTKEHPAKRVEERPKRHHQPQLATTMAKTKVEQQGRVKA
jgi:hypothetical protein